MSGEGIPLPPESDQDWPTPSPEEDWADWEADAEALAAAEDDAPPELPPMSADELADAYAVHAAARGVHRAPRGELARLGGEFDPRGRHVGCDGAPDGTGRMVGGCGTPPGVACEHPRRGHVPGFVHPTRLDAERRLFGIDPPTVSV